MPCLRALRRRPLDPRRASLIALLHHPDPQAREAATSATNDPAPQLRQFATRATQVRPSIALAEMLGPGKDTYRQYAARALIYFPDPATETALREACRDPSTEVRQAARIALRCLRSQRR